MADVYFPRGRREEIEVNKRKKKYKKTETKKPKQSSKTDENPYNSYFSIKKCHSKQIFLGIITELNDVSAKIALPNNYKGYLMINDVSEILTKVLTEQVEGENLNEECTNEEEKILEMIDLYHIGQYVLCSVKKVETIKEKKSKILLTTFPSIVNAKLSIQSLNPNSFLCCAVSSIEDHGYIVDVGIPEMKGFLRYTDVDLIQRKLRIGETIIASIKSFSSNVVSLSFCRNEFCNIFSIDSTKNPLKIHEVMPGLKVKSKIAQHLPNGMIVTFCKGLQGFLNWFHLPTHVLSYQEMVEKYPLKTELNVRVLYCDKLKKTIYFTAKSHFLDFTVPSFDCTIGEIMKDRTVSRLDVTKGLLVCMKEDLFGYVHISCIEDTKMMTISPTQYSEGKNIQVRVISFNPIENYVCLSSQPSILNSPFFLLEQIQVGSKVEGKIILINENGILVKITETICGFIPVMFLSDVLLKNPSKKYKLNSKIQCKVLSVDLISRKIILTSKKTLLKSEYPIITDYNVPSGFITYGVVIQNFQFGYLLKFYNNCVGVLPTSDIKANGMIVDELYLGKVLKVSVGHCDSIQKKIYLSLNNSHEQYPFDLKAFNSLNNGDILTCIVHSSSTQGIRVLVQPSNSFHFIHFSHLSDHPSLNSSLLSTYSKPGLILEKVLVVCKNETQMTLSLKKTLLDKYAITKTECQLNESYFGFITKITKNGFFVQLVINQLNGFVHLSKISNKFINSNESLFTVGQTVKCCILSKVEEQIQLSIKDVYDKTEEDLLNFITSYLESIETIQTSLMSSYSETSLKIFKKIITRKPIKGIVESIESFGVIVELTNELKGVIIHQHTGKQLSIGESIRGYGIDIDIEKSMIDMTTHSYSFLNPKENTQRIVPMTVLLVKELYLIVLVNDINIGIVPIVSYNSLVKKPFDTYFINQKLTGRVMSLPKCNSDYFYHSSLIVLMINEDQNDVKRIKCSKDISEGKIINCEITEITPTFISTKVNSSLNGRIDINECESMNINQYKIGQNVQARVISSPSHSLNPTENSILQLSLLNLSAKTQLQQSSYSNLNVGDSISGIIKNVSCPIQSSNEKWFWVQISSNLNARLFHLECSLELEEVRDAKSTFKIGRTINGYVSNKKNDQLYISLLKPRVFKPNDRIPAIITKITQFFIYVKIAFGRFGKIHITDVHDHFVKAPFSTFSIGQLVLACVLFDDEVTCELSLRPSRVSIQLSTNVDKEVNSIADIQEEDILRGYIKNMETAGCFIMLGRNIVGRVLIKDLSDMYINDWKLVFPIGKLVKSKVLKIEGNRIDLTLKESLISNSGQLLVFDDLREESILEGIVRKIEKYGIFITIRNTIDNLSGLAHRSKIFDQDTNQNLEELYQVGDLVKCYVLEINKDTKKISLGLKASYFPEDLSDEDEQENEEIKTCDDICGAIGEIDWNIEGGLNVPVHVEETVKLQETSNQKTDGSITKVPRKTKLEKEKLIQEKETKIVTNQLPENPNDFKRLLVGSPNNSLLWIQYISYYLNLNEVEKAREVVQNALKTISDHDGNERINIWKAFLNFENKVGSEESFKKAFSQALTYNDPKVIYFHVLDVYEGDGTEKKLFDFYEEITKKFHSSKKGWIRYGTALIKRKKVEESKRILKRALTILPKRKHVAVISKYAQLEFKYGEPERGRTIMEEILSCYPKRVDVWSIYLDHELVQGNFFIIRRLFDRVISLNLSSKKMKFFFKKYLEFEKEHGDAETIEYVKQKAREYVETKIN